jgi:meso-butanediol dehydrogenase / (S,S)-butanediol dehydrogenase / diacetyl reductase
VTASAGTTANERRSLAGRCAVVTGASSGIGAHVVRRLVQRGADVVAAARRRDRLDRLAAELATAPGRVVPVTADVTVDRDALAMIAAAVEAFGRIDALVNNAGSEVQAPIDRLSEADFEGMWRANVLSVYLCTRAALPELRRSRGVVVNLGSTVVNRPPRGRFGYVSCKGAVEAMTRALAVDLGRDGIRVNVIRPGIIPSELRGLTEDEERSRFEAGGVFGRQALATVGDGRDVAETVAWLCGPGGRFVTGTVIDVDGGYTLGIVDAAG